jgi:hypothetical protein
VPTHREFIATCLHTHTEKAHADEKWEGTMPTAADEPGQANLRPPDKANHFELTGKHREITYEGTTVTGLPQLIYRDRQEPGLNETFTGDRLRLLSSTETGLMVSVMLRARPDRDTLYLSLLVPEVNLEDRSPKSISTLAILTTHHTTFGGPNLVKGPLQTYEVVALEGTARFIVP